MKFPTTGLYAITQTLNKSDAEVIAEVTAAIRGGAAIIQYRDKQPRHDDKLAIQLCRICRSRQVPLIVNDDIDLAQRIGADGVHLGREDGNIGQARQRLGQDFIIGSSCYNSIQLAIEAEKNGASYVAFGRFFSSNTKPLATPASLSTLRLAEKTLTLPIVAIGGIVPRNGAQLLDAGADILAAIGGIFDHDPEQAARNYQILFNSTNCPKKHSAIASS